MFDQNRREGEEKREGQTGVVSKTHTSCAAFLARETSDTSESFSYEWFVSLRVVRFLTSFNGKNHISITK